MSIKYYRLAEGEKLPDEFCAVRDVGGEPSEYTFYVPESSNDALRELVRDMWDVMWACAEQRCQHRDNECFIVNGNGDHKGYGECWYETRMRELGVEVEG